MLRKIFFLFFLVFVLEGNLFALEEKKLSSGVNLVYKNIPNVKVVSVQVWMKTGSSNETPEINGISHFLEHLVFKGTKSFKPDEIDLIVESKGGQMNAATSKDYTFYYITIPAYNAEVAFNILSEMVFDASFIKDEIDKERPIVIQEIKRKYDSPTYDMWKFLSDTLNESTPYAMEIIGTEGNINAFSKQQIVDYYNRFYHPQNMSLVVVGDIDFKKAENFALKYFNKTKDVTPGKGYSLQKQKNIENDVFKNIKKELAQTYGVISYKAFPAYDKKSFALDVLNEILTGGENSLLASEIKNKLNLVTSIQAGYYAQKYVGSFSIYFTAEEKNVGKIITEIDKIIKSVFLGNLDENIITGAKNRLKSHVVFQRENTSSEANDIGYYYTLGIPEYYYRYTDLITAVTKEDIVAVAKEIFEKNRAIVTTSKDDPLR